MQKINFNHGWIFTQEGTDRREEVILPHDGMIHTKRNPDMHNYFLLAGFEGGTYVYTKQFSVPKEDQGKHYILEPEGVYCMSSVYVNGKLAYEKPYGYTAFQVLLDPFLKYGGKNEVRIEARVPKEGHGRWYTGGGIYRPVNLYVGGENYIKLYGVKVTTLEIAESSVEEGAPEAAKLSAEGDVPTGQAGEQGTARIRVDVEICGSGLVEAELLDQGERIALGMVQGEKGRASMEFTVHGAKLWSAQRPYLYKVRVRLREAGRMVDEVTECFGIRTLAVDPARGLLVNEKQVFLRGGCIHNDNGVIGVINNAATELHRAKILKKSGFNAIRSAHHPMSRALMDACDEVGLYVMDEAFDYWYRPKAGNPHNSRFLETFREDTRAMVQDAYNHPCVILYSIGNEIPEGGGVKGVRVGKEILKEIRSIDTTRLTTFCPSVHWLREYLDGTSYLTEDEDEWMAEGPERKDADWKHYMKIFMGAAANVPEDEKNQPYPSTYVKMDEDATKNLYPHLDVAGYNYMEDKYEILHQLHPERVLLGTETRGIMIVDTMRYAREHPFLIGDFIWTLQEHLGEANCGDLHYERPQGACSGQAGEEKLPLGEGPAGSRFPHKNYPWLINYGGTIDLTGTILPSIHRYEFAWDPDKKGLYLASQPPIHDGIAPTVSSYRWTDTVEGWTYEGCEGQKTWVDVYTDAAEAAVFINGREVGRSRVEDYYAKIPAVYEPGELMGVGYDETGREIYRTVVQTAGEATFITAVPDKKYLETGGEDFCFIEVSITDDAGNLKLLPEHKVSVTVEGTGMLQGFGSAYHLNEEAYNQSHHTTYLGRLLAVVRSGMEAGQVKVTFSSEGLADTIIMLHTHRVTGF